jgi:hypothetical protein
MPVAFEILQTKNVVVYLDHKVATAKGPVQSGFSIQDNSHAGLYTVASAWEASTRIESIYFCTAVKSYPVSVKLSRHIAIGNQATYFIDK